MSTGFADGIHATGETKVSRSGWQNGSATGPVTTVAFKHYRRQLLPLFFPSVLKQLSVAPSSAFFGTKLICIYERE